LKGELTKEKKFEPTPEMKAKIDELIRKVEAQEVRELSADELDGVAGGQGCFARDGVAYISTDTPMCDMTVDEFYDIVKWAYDTCGVDNAIGMANELFPSIYNEKTLRTGGPEYMRDTLRSRIIHMASGDFNPFSVWG
jgi:hypothetical protein